MTDQHGSFTADRFERNLKSRQMARQIASVFEEIGLYRFASPAKHNALIDALAEGDAEQIARLCACSPEQMQGILDNIHRQLG